MTLTFLLRRRSAIKVLGSVIDAAQRRGHLLFLCTEHEEAKEPFQPGDFARWPKLAASRTHGLLYGTIIGLATDPLAMIGVSSWMDNVLHPYHKGARVQCYLSEWHQTLHQQTQPTDAAVIAQHPIVGWTLADHRALLGPTTSPGYDLLFTMKRRVPEPWRRSFTGRLWYFKKVKGAHCRAQKSGVPLVIKTRRKHGDPWWMKYFGPIVGEDSMYPATSLRLLAGARIAHHFMSGAHTEARLMNVPVINYTVPQRYLDVLPGQRQLYQGLLREMMSREEYMAKFFTHDDWQAGERVMDVVEAL